MAGSASMRSRTSSPFREATFWVTSVIVVIHFIVLIAISPGCSRQTDGPERIGGLSKQQAFMAARAARMELLRMGFSVDIYPTDASDDASDSMGRDIPHYGYLVTIDDWDNLAVGKDVIRRVAGGLTVHRVTYSDGDGNFKTAGITNRRSDPGWMNVDSYKGTLAFSIDYDPGLK